jgi:hypothetical protein
LFADMVIALIPLHVTFPLPDLALGDPGTRARLRTGGAWPVRLT